MDIILGIDPGSRCTGYGVIGVKGSEQRCIAYGQLRTKGKSAADRLHQIYKGLRDVIATHQPQEAAIEQVFVRHNPQSSLTLGQARGAALVAAASDALTIAEYTPREIKQAVVGYGAADKSQVQHMITKILNLKEKPPSDAADALAIAVCHSHSRRLAKQLADAIIVGGEGS